MYERLQKAISLANRVHTNKPDKLGYPSILHPLRVMLKGDPSNESDLIVRVLHDVLEDADDISFSFIEAMEKIEVTPDELHALYLLTHRKNEPYQDYIRDICKEEWSRNIKRDDILDNFTRMKGLDPEIVRRMGEKYMRALGTIDSWENKKYGNETQNDYR